MTSHLQKMFDLSLGSTNPSREQEPDAGVRKISPEAKKSVSINVSQTNFAISKSLRTVIVIVIGTNYNSNSITSQIGLLDTSRTVPVPFQNQRHQSWLQRRGLVVQIHYLHRMPPLALANHQDSYFHKWVELSLHPLKTKGINRATTWVGSSDSLSTSDANTHVGGPLV
jgi:hypothetical protein